MSELILPGAPAARGQQPGGMGLDDHIYNRLLKDRILFLGSEVRDENASDAPIRNMNTGAAVGPPRKLMTWPIGDVHVSGAPQCHSTWTPIMNTTARPRARSKARTRPWGASPVIESVGTSPGTVAATAEPACIARL